MTPDHNRGSDSPEGSSLQDLGYDEWFAERAAAVLGPEQSVARVMAIDRGACLVRDARGEVQAEFSGKLLYEAGSGMDLPCVGDWVRVTTTSPDLAIIQGVLPRKTSLHRKAPGKTVEFQMIGANIDTALIVQSCHYDFNIHRLERYLVAATEGGIEPVVVLTKTDLVTADELQALMGSIREAGITTPLLPLSNVSGTGLEGLRTLLVPRKTYCLLGSSGVGKSTIINRLMGNEALETRDVSVTGEGVHTTVRRQLLLLDDGAMLIDTPGMRELGLLGASDGVEESFSEIAGLASACRFSDCTHVQEPGCAVRAAVESGELSRDRYESYLKLRQETAFYDLSYAEKRKKDKDLGRFYKSAKQEVRKKRVD